MCINNHNNIIMATGHLYRYNNYYTDTMLFNMHNFNHILNLFVINKKILPFLEGM